MNVRSSSRNYGLVRIGRAKGVSSGLRQAATIDTTPQSFLADAAAYIRVPYSAATIGVRDEISVGCWVKFTQGGNNGIIARNAYPSHRSWGLESFSTYVLNMLAEDGVNVTKGYQANDYAVGDGRWHHVVFTYKDTVQKLYVDGVASALYYYTDLAWAGSPALLGDTTVDLTIGCLLSAGSPSDFFQGHIYQPRAFHKQLTSTQVSEWFNSGTRIELSALSFASYAIAAYRFDGADTAAVVRDESGQANNGVLSSGTTAANFVSTVPGYLARWNGWHLTFNGSSQYVTVPHSSSLNLSTDITVFIAFKYTDTSGEQGLFSKADYGAGLRSWFIEKYFANRNRVAVFLSTDGGAAAVTKTTSVDVNDGKWHSFAFTISGGSAVKTYLDGLLDSTATIGSGLYQNTTVPVLVGGLRNSGSAALLFNGSLDEPRIYNTALTAAQITALHLAVVYNDVDTTTLDSAANMKLGFRCGDDQSGTGTPAFADISGNSNTGTNTGLTSGSFVQGA